MSRGRSIAPGSACNFRPRLRTVPLTSALQSADLGLQSVRRQLRFPPPFCRDQTSDAGNHANPADDRPLHIPGHEATRQYIDTLQEPDCARESEAKSGNVQSSFHTVSSRAHRPRAAAPNKRENSADLAATRESVVREFRLAGALN